MNLEIERKFLVDHSLWEQAEKPKGVVIIQSYLSTNPNKVVRVRLFGDKGFLTVKGKTTGVSRAEFEYEIPVEDALQMIDSMGEGTIEKIRYTLTFKNKTWEVDHFKGENNGLLMAEIELTSEEEQFEKPPWLLEEVSDDARYFNSNLQLNPYCNW